MLNEVGAAEGFALEGAGAQRLLHIGVLGAGQPVLPVIGRIAFVPFVEFEKAGECAQADAGGGTRPAVIRGGVGESGTHRISFDIEQGSVEVRFVERAGVVTSLPKVTAAALVLGVDVAGILRMSAAEGLRHRVGGVRDDDPMHVIRHEAPAVEVQVVVLGGAHDEAEVGGAIFV